MPDHPNAAVLTDTAERAWRWVLDQVRTDEVGPWIPGQVTGTSADETPPAYRDGMHSGIAGLAHALAEIRLHRTWTEEESVLAEAIGARLRERSATELGYTFFDGLVSDIGAFVALGQDGASAAVDRLAALAEPDGWPQSVAGPPRALPDARISDATLGTASIVLGTLWADRQGVAAAREVLEKAADVLLAEAEDVEGDVLWRFMPDPLPHGGADRDAQLVARAGRHRRGGGAGRSSSRPSRPGGRGPPWGRTPRATRHRDR